MNTLALLVGVLLCLAVVNGRSFDERRDDPVAEAEEVLKKHGNEMRHQRRRRWQMNYGYEYPSTLPAYYPDRGYDRNQQDYLPRIIKLLEDISTYVKRPQPPPLPPQPIYIPYPVPYPVPHYVPCAPQTPKNPNVTIRFPDMEDPNQNWGYVKNEDEMKPSEDDGSRPINFDPIKPKRPMKRPVPKVDHGSVQSDDTQTTQSPRLEDSLTETARAPIACSAAMLACCADKNQRQHCFNTFGCGSEYDTGKACDSDSLKEALEALKSSYSPMP